MASTVGVGKAQTYRCETMLATRGHQRPSPSSSTNFDPGEYSRSRHQEVDSIEKKIFVEFSWNGEAGLIE